MSTQRANLNGKSTGTATAASLCGLAAALLFFPGCSANHYRKSADKQTYTIIQQVEKQVFGHTNAFTINTPYSARKPEAIPPAS